MFILFGYLLFRLRNIYMFFKQTISSGNFTYIDNMASNYINIVMLIIVISITIGAILIWLLMKQKEKPVLFYKILIAYGITLIIAFGVYYGFFKSLEFNEYKRSVLVIYRDIIGILYYINYFYIIFSFVRGFGFDIRKFSFEKDLKNLDISLKDNEEYEVDLNVDSEKIVDKIRKEKRMILYYIKENLRTLIVLGLISILFITAYIFYNKNISNKIFRENETIACNDLNYKVLESYIFTNNRFNEKISIDKKYIVIKFEVENNSNTSKTIDTNKFRIMINNNYYYPVYNKYSQFLDIGIGYDNNKLISNSKNNYILVFEVNKKVNFEELILNIYNKFNNDKTYYKSVKLDFSLENNKTIGEYNLSNEIKINNDIVKDTTLVINDFLIKNNFSYNYQECINEKCNDYKKIIEPSFNKKVIKINYNLTSNMKEEEFFNNYLMVEYTKDNNTKIISAKDIGFLNNNKNDIYLDLEIDDYTNINLIFNIRGIKYIIKTK